MARHDNFDRTKMKMWVANDCYGRWQDAARHAGAPSLCAWVRGVCDRAAALQGANERNPWLEGRQGELGSTDVVRRSKGRTKEKTLRTEILRGLDRQIAQGRMARRRLAEPDDVGL